jgi:hypothetical protein
MRAALGNAQEHAYLVRARPIRRQVAMLVSPRRETVQGLGKLDNTLSVGWHAQGIKNGPGLPGAF